MGTLIALRYSTKLFANLADHTYVTCGTGRKAWGCWGGKTGGTVLRQGTGSTARANAIAGADEKANIRCYLINGVCHQAANRILFPAGITVAGARGYGVSESLFGPYGRPSGPFGTCASPFNQYPTVAGDIPDCAGPAVAGKVLRTAKAQMSSQERLREKKYLGRVLASYGKAGRMFTAKHKHIGPEAEGFHVEIFLLKAEYNLGRLDRALTAKLTDIRRSAERSRMQIEHWYSNNEMRLAEFAKAFDRETVVFQDTMAGALKADQYKALFGLQRGETITLANPAIVKAMSRGAAPRRRGKMKR